MYASAMCTRCTMQSSSLWMPAIRSGWLKRGRGVSSQYSKTRGSLCSTMWAMLSILYGSVAYFSMDMVPASLSRLYLSMSCQSPDVKFLSSFSSMMSCRFRPSSLESSASNFFPSMSLVTMISRSEPGMTLVSLILPSLPWSRKLCSWLVSTSSRQSQSVAKSQNSSRGPDRTLLTLASLGDGWSRETSTLLEPLPITRGRGGR
mmetsp:Transcript_72627/g.224581  ORF Transcript_72627/g.224581 Transcript_72627/m.224581 type:complete len:204 (+) Transcript_72627:716-1327(+)